MKKILFVVSLIGAWLIGKIKLSEPPTITYSEFEWNNPFLEIIEHETDLKEVTLFNDGVEIDQFVVFSDIELENYMKEQYGVNILWL